MEYNGGKGDDQRGRKGHGSNQSRKEKKKQQQEERAKLDYRNLNEKQLMEWYGSAIEPETIRESFLKNDRDMDKTCRELTFLSGIKPEEKQKIPKSLLEDDSLEAVELISVQEVEGDLFSCAEDAALAHCISSDVRMGKGIAVAFKKEFGGVEELKGQGKGVGQMAFLHRGNRYVYYMITKESYWHKPTYATLQSSLKEVKEHCVANGVQKLCMPRIGCGLDGLLWATVRDMIRKVFAGTTISITIYAL